MSIEIKGTSPLIGKLRRNATLRDVRRVVALNGYDMQKRTKRYAPNVTGTLERSIKLSFIDGGFTARINATVNYAGYVEWGTRYFYGRFYMRKAFFEQRRVFKRDLSRLMK